MYGDPDVVRHIGAPIVKDVDEQRERLLAIIERNQTKWAGRYGSWPLFERATGELVGTAILKPIPASGTNGGFSEDIEIGWHLARRHWGRGLASEAARALLALGFQRFELPLLHAVVEAPNTRSLAVARRIGMRHVGKTSAYYDLELEHFEITADEHRQSLGTSS